jgi:uncharacterized protein YaiL (DUF2058 family)
MRKIKKKSWQFSLLKKSWQFSPAPRKAGTKEKKEKIEEEKKLRKGLKNERAEKKKLKKAERAAMIKELQGGEGLHFVDDWHNTLV